MSDVLKRRTRSEFLENMSVMFGSNVLNNKLWHLLFELVKGKGGMLKGE